MNTNPTITSAQPTREDLLYVSACLPGGASEIRQISTNGACIGLINVHGFLYVSSQKVPKF